MTRKSQIQDALRTALEARETLLRALASMTCFSADAEVRIAADRVYYSVATAGVDTLVQAVETLPEASSDEAPNCYCIRCGQDHMTCPCGQ